jgi:hypothetical protein
MARPTVRNIDAATMKRLRVRAACHSQSMHAEPRTILKDVIEWDEECGSSISRRRSGEVSCRWAALSWSRIRRYRSVIRLRLSAARNLDGGGVEKME